MKISDVAGGKNLFNPKCLLNATYDKKTNTITVSNNLEKALDMVFKENTQYTFSAYIKQSNSNTNIRLGIEYTDGTIDSNFLLTQSTSEVYISTTSQSGKTISEVKWYWGAAGTTTFRNLQIEEGTTATSYEPYIPSVKMLADEVSSQNESLEDYGLVNVFDGGLVQGYIKESDGSIISNSQYITSDSVYKCSEGDTVIIKYGEKADWFGVGFYNNGTFVSISQYRTTTKEYKVSVPSGVNQLKFYIGYDTPSHQISSTNHNKIALYINNAIDELKNDLSNLKDGTTSAAKAVADEDGNNIKSTYAKKTETLETVTEDVNVVLNSDLFDSTYSDITCVRIGKLCVLSFTIRVKNTISSTIDKIVLMTIVGTKYLPKKPDVSSPRQTFQGFAVGNYDENGTQSQSRNNTVRIITSSADNYTEIITRDKDRLNWNGYVQGQIMWVTD